MDQDQNLNQECSESAESRMEQVPQTEIPSASKASADQDCVCNEIPPAAAPPQQSAAQLQGRDKKIVAGILAILLGSLGIHKFYLGYTVAGLIMLLVSLVGGILTCGATSGIVSIIALVEGILYLTKSDAEFYETYIVRKKEWF